MMTIISMTTMQLYDDDYVDGYIYASDLSHLFVTHLSHQWLYTPPNTLTTFSPTSPTSCPTLYHPLYLSTTTDTTVGHGDHRESYHILTILSHPALPSTNPQYLSITYTHRYSSGARSHPPLTSYPLPPPLSIPTDTAVGHGDHREESRAKQSAIRRRDPQAANGAGQGEVQ